MTSPFGNIPPGGLIGAALRREMPPLLDDLFERLTRAEIRNVLHRIDASTDVKAALADLRKEYGITK